MWQKIAPFPPKPWHLLYPCPSALFAGEWLLIITSAYRGPERYPAVLLWSRIPLRRSEMGFGAWSEKERLRGMLASYSPFKTAVQASYYIHSLRSIYVLLHFINMYYVIQRTKKKITPGQLWVIVQAGVTRGRLGGGNKNYWHLSASLDRNSIHSHVGGGLVQGEKIG